jgi:hypothetical protein
MTEKSRDHSYRWLCRAALLLLLIAACTPEIVIRVTVALARLKGCELDQEDPCLLGMVPVSDIIDWTLQLSARYVIAALHSTRWWLVHAVVAGWLIACYIVLVCGWSSLLSRLGIGFVVMVISAVLPYFGPMLAIASLSGEKCQPNEGVVGACTVFGGYVGDPCASPVHDAVLLGWEAPSGARLSLAIFAVYAIVVIALRLILFILAKRSSNSA